MNITTQISNLPLATVFNPQTDNLRRENNQRELISQPAAAHQSAAEKGVNSERDKQKLANTNQEIDFLALQKKAEHDTNTIHEQSGQQSDSHKQQQSQQQETSTTSTDKATADINTADEQAQTAKQQQQVQQQVAELKARDTEVRAHEAAHAAAGGSTTGAPSFSFKQGPDGVRYAVNGEVSVDVSPVSGDPAATIVKMQQVHAAALAPANPSAQDKRIAAIAASTITKTQAELSAPNAQPVNASTKTDQPQDEHAKLLASHQKSSDFNQFIKQTLADQEHIAPSISSAVQKRAVRIESFYAKITQANEQSNQHHFQLTA